MFNVKAEVLRLYQEACLNNDLWHKNLSKCESMLKLWIGSNFNDEEAIINLGAVLSDLGKHREAIMYLKMAEGLGSQDRNMSWNMAVAKMNIEKERPTAMEYFNRAKGQSRNPKTIEAYFDPHGH